MATFQEGRYLDRIAGADLSGKSYHIVKQVADATQPGGRTVVLATGATDDVFGVLNNTPSKGDVANVCARNGEGTFKVVLGGTVALGDRLTSDANGAAVTATATGTYPSTAQVFGVAQEAGVAGQVIEYALVNYKI
jgi:hypothetical protein